MTQKELEAEDKAEDERRRKKEKRIEKLASGKNLFKCFCYFVLAMSFVGMLIMGVVRHHHKYVRTMVGSTWVMNTYSRGKRMPGSDSEIYIQDQDTGYMNDSNGNQDKIPLDIENSGKLSFSEADTGLNMTLQWVPDKSSKTREVFKMKSMHVPGHTLHITNKMERKAQSYVVMSKK